MFYSLHQGKKSLKKHFASYAVINSDSCSDTFIAGNVNNKLLIMICSVDTSYKKSTNSYHSLLFFQANEAFKFVMQRKSTGKVVINTR